VDLGVRRRRPRRPGDRALAGPRVRRLRRRAERLAVGERVTVETPDLEGFSTDPVVEGGFPELGDPIGWGTAVRVGEHEGYDRVTFEFSGSGTPSFQVQYTDDPRSQGSGDPVPVEGDAVLQVTVTSVQVPEDPAPSMTTPDTDGTVFAQVEGIWGGFEGYGETFLGIDGGERPFKVTVLQDPMRLVVDVANG
jgi:hypothetical protein